MKRGRLPSEMWETFRAMSVDVARLKEFVFMRETAMMSLEERKLVGLCMFAKDVFEDDDFSEFVDEYAIPFFTYMGRAKWGRDVVTDLGFALATRRTGRKKLGESLLKFEPQE